MLKPWISVGLVFILTGLSNVLHADSNSSETLTAQKGLFRLLSADVNEQDEYHFRTSVQYFYQRDLLKDSQNSTVDASEATLGFGYALLPEIHLSAFGGFKRTTSEPDVGSTGPGLSAGSQTINHVRGGVAVTGTYDVGQWMSLSPQRLTAGLSLSVNLGQRLTRFLNAPDVSPTFILTHDQSDAKLFPYRTHFNVGYRMANADRIFDDSDTYVLDFDALAYDMYSSQVITTGLGIELPFEDFCPSLEFAMNKPMDQSLSRAPKWVTLGLKGNPFPQKNIEIFGAVDFGISSFKAHPISVNARPVSPAVPLWNAVFGFGISQFGRRAGEVGVNQREYETVKKSLTERERMISGLERDLEFNTVQGRVIDAQTKLPMEGVEISMPENGDFKASKTAADGKFVRYFRSLSAGRVVFAKEGFESSSKFLSLKPGERVTVDIELKKATGETLADFVATVTDASGRGVGARVSLKHVDTGEVTVGTADPTGQLNLKVKEGRYLVEIRADGYRAKGDQIEFQRGKTVLRSFSLDSSGP